jgi:hypothetical protein
VALHEKLLNLVVLRAVIKIANALLRKARRDDPEMDDLWEDQP